MNTLSLRGRDTTLLREFIQNLPSRNLSIVGFVGDGGSQTFQSDSSVSFTSVPQTIWWIQPL